MWRGGGATRGRSIDRGGSTRTGQARERAHPGEDRDRERQQPVEPVRDRVRHRVRAARSERREGETAGRTGGGGWESARETWRAAVNATIHDENARRPLLLSNRSNVVAALPSLPPCTLAARAGSGPGCRLARARRSRRRRSCSPSARSRRRTRVRSGPPPPRARTPRARPSPRSRDSSGRCPRRVDSRTRTTPRSTRRERRGPLATLRPRPFPPSIPRVIHVLWKTEKLPAFAEAYVSGWIANHPAWRVRRWTDADMLAFVRERFPADEALWHKFPTGVFRADTFRYMLLSALGGVYVDLDMESLRPMDPLLANRRCLLGQEPAAHARLIAGVPRRACNAWMASEANHPFWDAVLDEIRTRARTIPMTKFNPPSVTAPRRSKPRWTDFRDAARTDRVRRRGPAGGALPGGRQERDRGDAGEVRGVDAGARREPGQSRGRRVPRAEILHPGGGRGGGGGSDVRGGTFGDEGDSGSDVRRRSPLGGDDPRSDGGHARGAGEESAERRGRLLRADGEGRWANPPREALATRGAVAVHHWVHTWLDGPDARVSNAWRRRNALGVEDGTGGGGSGGGGGDAGRAGRGGVSAQSTNAKSVEVEDARERGNDSWFTNTRAHVPILRPSSSSSSLRGRGREVAPGHPCSEVRARGNATSKRPTGTRSDAPTATPPGALPSPRTRTSSSSTGTRAHCNTSRRPPSAVVVVASRSRSRCPTGVRAPTATPPGAARHVKRVHCNTRAPAPRPRTSVPRASAHGPLPPLPPRNRFRSHAPTAAPQGAPSRPPPSGTFLCPTGNRADAPTGRWPPLRCAGGRATRQKRPLHPFRTPTSTPLFARPLVPRRNTSRCPPFAANAHVHSSHGNPF